MKTIDKIQKIFDTKSFAVSGVSRKKGKMGNEIYKAIKSKHFDVVAINPNADEVEGDRCYRSIADIPDKGASLVVVAPKSETLKIVKEAIDAGIQNILLQHGTFSQEAVDYAESKGVNIVSKHCFFMFFEPVKSIHNFHKNIYKLFGKYPK